MTPEQLREHVHGIIPDSWLGITGPLTDEQRKDLEKYCEYVSFARHTVDIDRQPMSFEDATRSERIWDWCVFWGLVAAAIGFCFGRWVLPHWVGP